MTSRAQHASVFAIALLVGGGLFAYLVWRTGPQTRIDGLAAFGIPTYIVIVILGVTMAVITGLDGGLALLGVEIFIGALIALMVIFFWTLAACNGFFSVIMYRTRMHVGMSLFMVIFCVSRATYIAYVFNVTIAIRDAFRSSVGEFVVAA